MHISSRRFRFHARPASWRGDVKGLAACLLAAALLFALTGCQSGAGQPSASANAGGAIATPGGQFSGSGHSGTDDYRTVLADPGPF